MRPKRHGSGNVVRDIHQHVVKEPIGRGVFADDPTKPRDAVVFRKDHLVMLYMYQGEVTDHEEAMRQYGTHTNPYSYQSFTRRIQQ